MIRIKLSKGDNSIKGIDWNYYPMITPVGLQGNQQLYQLIQYTDIPNKKLQSNCNQKHHKLTRNKYMFCKMNIHHHPCLQGSR